jgi:hypothetical protein
MGLSPGFLDGDAGSGRIYAGLLQKEKLVVIGHIENYHEQLGV